MSSLPTAENGLFCLLRRQTAEPEFDSLLQNSSDCVQRRPRGPEIAEFRTYEMNGAIGLRSMTTNVLNLAVELPDGGRGVFPRTSMEQLLSAILPQTRSVRKWGENRPTDQRSVSELARSRARMCARRASVLQWHPAARPSRTSPERRWPAASNAPALRRRHPW